MIAQACGKVGVASIAHTCAKGGVPLGGSIHDLEGGGYPRWQIGGGYPRWYLGDLEGGGYPRCQYP